MRATLRDQRGIGASRAPLSVGAPTLLCPLAVRAEWPRWLADDDAGNGALAVAAQMVTTRRPTLHVTVP